MTFDEYNIIERKVFIEGDNDYLKDIIEKRNSIKKNHYKSINDNFSEYDYMKLVKNKKLETLKILLNNFDNIPEYDLNNIAFSLIHTSKGLECFKLAINHKNFSKDIDLSSCLLKAVKYRKTNFVSYLLNLDFGYFKKKNEEIASKAFSYSSPNVLKLLLKKKDLFSESDLYEGLFQVCFNGKLSNIKILFDSIPSFKNEYNSITFFNKYNSNDHSLLKKIDDYILKYIFKNKLDSF